MTRQRLATTQRLPHTGKNKKTLRRIPTTRIRDFEQTQRTLSPAPPAGRAANRHVARHKNPRHFQIIAGAVLQRHRLRIDYFNRERDEISQREIYPQRLAHYRDNLYLDAWEQNSKAGQHSSAKVHRTLTVTADGSYTLNNLDELSPEEIDRF